MVIVHEANNRSSMYVDFTNINFAYPKDSYPLSYIDFLIDGSLGYHVLRVMHAYSRYKRIHMDPLVASKTAFFSSHRSYYYNSMPFSIKNVGATYQRLIDVVFVN